MTRQYGFLRHTLGTLSLLLFCPPLVMLIWYTNTHLNGSLLALWQLIQAQGLFQVIYHVWAPIFWGSKIAWAMISIFILFQLLLLHFLPGRKVLGPLTPKGNTPVYKANGVIAFFCTLSIYIVASFYLHLFAPSIIYDQMGPLLGALNIFSLILCLLLYLKGRFFPSSTDHSVSGNFIFDYYWGTELYPIMGKTNLKMFITCRVGMMSWGIILISYAAKQDSLYGLSNSLAISIFLQLCYLAKFYIWESGYLRSLDIMHDRAGFYICWGCLVWVPCIYTSPSMFLVLHPIQLQPLVAYSILILGVTSITINYLADRQRQLIRATNGKCQIWGRTPKLQYVTYTTEQGEKKQSLLLHSGWWGISRHFHYLPEIIAAFCWSLPALFTHFMPYFYVTFLTILLIDRAFRDDRRCAKKYGKDWQVYCERVPYKMIPYII